MNRLQAYKFIYIFAFISLTLAENAVGQTKYWVSFTKKTARHFDPYKFFDLKTIQNRIQNRLPLSDWYDLPVDSGFIQSVTKIADSTGYSSRWLNGMAVYADPQELSQISALPYVKGIEIMGNQSMRASISDSVKTIDPKDTDFRAKIADQIDGLEGNEMAAHGLTGKGIRIAILDVGFKNADKHPAFEYLRSHHGIIMTYDFLHHKENVYGSGAHGTAVLSCIAGKYKGINMGLAPDAEFLLARTEREATEFKDEEDAWVAAAEWAEQHGAQMISCSLGYTYQRYFYKDMNGRTSIATRGAAMAARKGILVCVAAGNEGEDNWKYVTAPGDCDSVLTVGGYDPKTGFHASFSSFGPSADGRLKPDVIAASTAWVASPTGYHYEEGTSFATPLIAGFAACVWQYLNGKTNMQILDTIHKLGSLYPYFDYAQGYGIPKAGYLFSKKQINDSAFTLYDDNDTIAVSLATSYFKDSSGIEKTFKNNYMYAKATDPSGRIHIYDVIKLNSQRFNLSNISRYLESERFGKNKVAGYEKYLKGWVVTVFFDHCLKAYHY